MNAKDLARSIADELKANPSSWHQGWFDNSIPVEREESTAWCLSGHMMKRGVSTVSAQYHVFRRHLNGESVCKWNDTPGRTVEEVIALCERVAA